MLPCILLLAGLLLAPMGATAETYSYTGGSFITVMGSTYTTAMRITGEFTLAAPLAPNLPWTDLSTQVMSYRFNDGVQMLTEANSAILVFLVGTDALGVPSTWEITVWATPITTRIGGQVAGIDVAFGGTSTQDDGFLDFVCIGTGSGGQCNSAVFNEESNFGALILEMPPTPGSWISDFSVVFSDGFETGDLTHWAIHVPTE